MTFVDEKRGIRNSSKPEALRKPRDNGSKVMLVGVVIGIFDAINVTAIGVVIIVLLPRDGYFFRAPRLLLLLLLLLLLPPPLPLLLLLQMLLLFCLSFATQTSTMS